MEAGASDLSTAQAGIYAFEDVYKYMLDNNSEGSVNNLSNDVFNDSVISLNKSYFSYALDRGIYFKTEKIKESNSLNTMQFYFSSGVVMLLMFTTLTCGSFYNKDSKTFWKFWSVKNYRTYCCIRTFIWRGVFACKSFINKIYTSKAINYI